MDGSLSQRRRFILLWLLIAFGCDPAVVWGQQTNPFFAEPSSGIAQVSLSKEAEPTNEVRRIRATAADKQLTVEIRYLLVDNETRRSIYEALDPEAIRHTAASVPDDQETEIELSTYPFRLDKRVTGYGHAATAVIDSTTADKIIQLAGDSPTNEVSQAPSVILQQEQAAEVNDVAQRPMVVDILRTAEHVQPVVRVVEEGIRIRLLARVVGESPSTRSIDLTTELVSKAITEVQTVEVLGLQEQPIALQQPISSTTTIVVGANLDSGQLMFIDPHLTKHATVEIETTSVFGKLPLVGKSFTATESVPVDRNLMVLIEPAAF